MIIKVLPKVCQSENDDFEDTPTGNVGVSKSTREHRERRKCARDFCGAQIPNNFLDKYATFRGLRWLCSVIDHQCARLASLRSVH